MLEASQKSMAPAAAHCSVRAVQVELGQRATSEGDPKERIQSIQTNLVPFFLSSQ